MKDVPFTKTQSIGNDFVFVHLDLFERDEDLIEFVRRACERRFGVGSDGLLALGRTDDPNRLLLRMFNPDGTEDFCGNGLRCAAHYALVHGWARSPFTIHHLGREVRVRAEDGWIETDLGPAVYEPSEVPLAPGETEWFERPIEVAGETVVATALTTGSTHTILFVDRLPDDERFFRLSPQLENHPLFPARTSVIWVQVESERRLKLRIWERGVGETLGCGSGSSAAASAYFRRSGLAGAVEVINPGGTVTVSMDDPFSPITIAGRAQIVFEGNWPVTSTSAD